MTIGITGAGGLLGFHLRALLLKEGEQFAIADRNAFKDEAALDDFVRKSDVIVHLAAETRGDDSKVYEENIKITEELLSSLRRTNSRKPVIFSSTVQIEQETGYGRSKRETGEALLAWGKETGSPVTVVVIQNVFGEYARPFHNSVVATFCTQLIKNEPSQVNGSASIQIMHAQAVAETLIHYVRSPQHGVIRMERGEEISVGALYEMLSSMKSAYDANDIPEIRSLFERRLFNTLRSYLPGAWYPRPLETKMDARGTLFETLRSENGGVTFVSTTKPGAVRGNHWHMRKMERFVVLRGDAEMRVRKLFSEETEIYRLSGVHPVFVDTQTFTVHSLVNVGQDELVTLFWGSEPFNPSDSDTFPEEV